ncbi:MAG: hypothetical protein IJP20_01595 [Clostridia bacterium]|nr:hypothetical protein [Clostridia bacterium]
MIKLLINIVAFVLCVGIIALGGYQTVKQSDFGSIQKDFVEAMTPVAPPQNPGQGGSETDKPGDGAGSETDKPGDDEGSETEKPGDGTGSETEKPEDGTGSETDKPGEDDDSSDIVDSPIDKEAMTDIYETYNPVTAEINKEILSNTITGTLDTDSEEGALAADIVISYVDNLYSAISDSYEDTQAKVESGEMTEEEAEQAKKEFIEKETAALDSMMGLVGSMNSDEGPSEEQLEQAVDTILDSTVVSNTIKENAETIDKESKDELQDVLQSAVDSVNGDVELGQSEKEELVNRYKDIAGLFGIELN